MNKVFYEYNFAEYEGKIPMDAFLEQLNYKEQAKVIAYMDKLVELLNLSQFPNEKLSKFLKEGIFELRIPLINTAARSLYFFLSDKSIIFTHGFIKKTEKTPIREIEKAIKIKEYYRSKK